MPLTATATLAALLCLAPSPAARSVQTVDLSPISGYLNTVVDDTEYSPVYGAVSPALRPFSPHRIVLGSYVGDTRAALLRYWTTEGGISSRGYRTFLLRDQKTGDIAYDKAGRVTRITVTFLPVGRPAQGSFESPNDRILKIEGPVRDYGLRID